MARKKSSDSDKGEMIPVSYRRGTEEGEKIHEWRQRQINVAYSVRQLILKDYDQTKGTIRATKDMSVSQPEVVDVPEPTIGNIKSGVEKFFDD
jgi:hypothetical protein